MKAKVGFNVVVATLLSLLAVTCVNSENPISKSNDVDSKDVRFKEPGVPDAKCVLYGVRLDLNDPRYPCGDIYCCLKRPEPCCLWAVPSPGSAIVETLYDDPITIVEVSDSDTVFTMGAMTDVDTTIHSLEEGGADTVIRVVDMRVDSTWSW